MSRTIRNEDHGTFSQPSGTWGSVASSGLWGTTPLTPATSGTVKFNAVAGSVYRMTLPAHHGFDWCAFIGHGAATNNPNATITVDGVLNQTWNQKFGSVGSDPNYYLPRILCVPIRLTDSASTQVIDITVGNGGGNFVIDGVELYTMEAATSGRIAGFGHSMLYGVTSGSDGTVRSGRFTNLFAQYLAKQLAVATVDYNQGVPSEDLTNGSYQSGASSLLMNTRYYNQPAIYTPGWIRNDLGDLWPNPAPSTGASFIVPNWISGTGSTANYYPGVAQWWASKFQVGVVMHGFNDRGYPALYDAGGAISNSPTNFRDAAGHATAPANPGWMKLNYQQRLREVLYRPIMNISGYPPQLVCGVANYNNGDRQTDGLGMLIDAWIREVIAEPFFVGKNVSFVDLLPATTGRGVVNVSSADPHPNDWCHRLIADELINVWDRSHNAPAGMGRFF